MKPPPRRAILAVLHAPLRQEESPMAWKKPRIVEVSLALEINAYACAEVG
ncbi:MAG: pyrroloquinoline quinone precursor peptide PqqA [Acetobacteraceae bacterium]|nr:pyrroloquinoline quinone precursor peptide PqqA [Acetobacteraceae bacterium]